MVSNKNIRFKQVLHAIVSWSAATFRHNPINILGRIFNIASFAMDAILSVYL